MFAFSDSTVALAWIAGEPHRWKTFVGNRVSEIQDIIPSSRWLHVTSEDNPADCASRGLLPGDLRAHPLWWTGPPWLKEPTHRWPTGCSTDSNIPGIAAEERAVPIFNLLVPSKTDDVIKRFSSLDRLKRVTAYCLRFHHNARTNCTGHTRQYGSITANELRNALICLVRMVQSSALHIEKEEVKKPKTRHHLGATTRIVS